MNMSKGIAAAALVLATFAAPASGATPAVTTAAVNDGPKVVFQINDAANASAVLRFVTNYLVSEPTAQITVVGYMTGIDFMLADAKDARDNPYELQLQALAERGVQFKVCNNTLKSRNLEATVVAKQASVVPSAVNEIIRLQTREGYAYFHHVK
jgi:intracellular sulfur oxidation DsrE/DsrF family protein